MILIINAEFEEYLVNLKVRSSRKKNAQKTVGLFIKYLNKNVIKISEATPKDLDLFLLDHTKRKTSKFDFDHLEYYYMFVNNKVMLEAIDKLKYKYPAPFMLNKFTGIKGEYIEKLKEVNIKTNMQLLYSADNEIKIERLSKETNIPTDKLIKLLKLSDLTRIFAVKAIRAQLYLNAGVDTVNKIALYTPENFRNIIVDYCIRTNFPGVPTLPSEAKFTIEFAKRLPVIIVFNQ